MDIKVIVPAKEIPDDALVTKVNGTAQYTLQSKIVIYPDSSSQNKAPTVIKVESGSKFIVGGNRIDSISAIDENKELVWHTDTYELQRYLERKNDSEND